MQRLNTARQINILLVEDNEGDILLTTEALQESRLPNIPFVVKDGWEALQFLEKKGEFKNAATPDLVLLDINLPKLNGHEVLREIRASHALKHLPVVMLSTSSSEKDRQLSQQNQASGYMTKPVNGSDIEEAWRKVQVPG